MVSPYLNRPLRSLDEVLLARAGDPAPGPAPGSCPDLVPAEASGSRRPAREAGAAPRPPETLPARRAAA